MSSIHPDQLGALGPLTGGVVRPRPRTWDPVTGDGSLVELSGQGQRVRIGRFLRPEMRAAFAQELRLALRTARTAP